MVKKRTDEVEIPQPEAVVEIPAEPSKEELETKRNGLINQLKPLLVTKRQMVEGGRIIRSKVSQESQYVPMITEINELGRRLGHGDVSIGMLRRE